LNSRQRPPPQEENNQKTQRMQRFQMTKATVSDTEVSFIDLQGGASVANARAAEPIDHLLRPFIPAWKRMGHERVFASKVDRRKSARIPRGGRAAANGSAATRSDCR